MTNEKTDNGVRRGFHRTSLAWYADGIKASNSHLHEIMFGLYDASAGGCDGEMAMRWIALGSSVSSMATNMILGGRLECFDDAFHLLPQFADVIERLAQTRDITEPEFAQLLIECGFEDMTEYADPDEDEEVLTQ